MKLLKTKRAWIKWVRDYGITDANVPDRFPCYGYEHCTSYGMEESEALYLYESTLGEMLLNVSAKITP